MSHLSLSLTSYNDDIISILLANISEIKTDSNGRLRLNMLMLIEERLDELRGASIQAERRGGNAS